MKRTPVLVVGMLAALGLAVAAATAAPAPPDGLEDWLSSQRYRVRKVGNELQLTHRSHPPMILTWSESGLAVSARVGIPYALRKRERALAASLTRLAEQFVDRGSVEVSPEEVALYRHLEPDTALDAFKAFWPGWEEAADALADAVDDLPVRAAAPPPRPFEPWVVPLSRGVSITLVWIPATDSEAWLSRSGGEPTFRMGSPPGEPGRDADELLHPVAISNGFWMAATEITRAHWNAVMSHGTPDPRDRRPVELSKQDAELFLARLNLLFPAQGFRMPTEAEWEYAARAGTVTAFAHGDDWDPAHGWVRAPGVTGPMPVGEKAPNPWGLHDMHGNVGEWVQDVYRGYDTASSQEEWVGAHHHVFRGGAYLFDARYARSAFRGGANPTRFYPGIGLRIVRDDVP